MKLTSFIGVLFGLPLICFSQYTYKHLQVNFLQTKDAAQAFTFNLRLYPVYSKESFAAQFKGLGHYSSFQEAIQKKKVKVCEKEAGGSVGTLVIENVSKDTIVIICGDVVKGGQQDRIVQKDMVVLPGSGKKQLEVFCVEAGRWATDERAPVLRDRKRAKETPPVFTTHFNKGSIGLRKIVEKVKSQARVWSKVEEINKKNGTGTATKTYTALTRSADFSRKIKEYVPYFMKGFASEKKVVGVVVVTGNRVLGCDLFATPELFASQFPSLLHSYVTEAIVSGQPVTASHDVIKEYMDKLLSDEASQMTILKQKGSAFMEKGQKLRISCYE